MKKYLLLAVLTLFVSCVTNNKLENYNAARLDRMEEYLDQNENKIVPRDSRSTEIKNESLEKTANDYK